MSQVERLARNGLRMEGATGENGELLSLRDHEDDGGGGGGHHGGGHHGGGVGSGARGYDDEDDVNYDGSNEKTRRSRNLGGHNDNCCEKILNCLGLIPCPSLLSWIALLLGVGCLTGSLLVSTWRTQDLLKKENPDENEDEILWFMEYTIIGVVVGMFVVGTLVLIASHLSSEPTSRRVFNSFSKNRCAQGLNIFALVLCYILTIAWTLVTAILATPLVYIINFYIVDPDRLDLSHYGFPGRKIYAGNDLEEFKEKTENLLISFGVAFFASVLIVNSLVCFIICISSNIAHLRDNRFATLNAYGAEEVRNSKHSVLDTNM